MNGSDRTCLCDFTIFNPIKIKCKSNFHKIPANVYVCACI